MTFSGNILIILPVGKSDVSLMQRLLRSMNLKVAKEIKMVIDLN